MKIHLSIINDVTVMSRCPWGNKNNDVAVCASYGPSPTDLSLRYV